MMEPQKAMNVIDGLIGQVKLNREETAVVEAALNTLKQIVDGETARTMADKTD